MDRCLPLIFVSFTWGIALFVLQPTQQPLTNLAQQHVKTKCNFEIIYFTYSQGPIVEWVAVWTSTKLHK